MIKPGNFKKATAIVGLVIVMLLITNCSSSDEPTPLPTNVSTNIPEPPPSDTPMPTPTSVSTPEPPPSDTPTPIPTRRVIPGLNSEPIVQYSADANRKFAQELADAKNYKIARAYSEADIETSTKWILVGGQFDNRIYNDHFEDLTLLDSGYINIAKTSFIDGEILRELWGVAGWNRLDTSMSISWMIDNVLPNDAQKLPWVVVQYCPEGDRGITLRLSNAFGWPVVNTCSLQDLSEHDGWILIGGQYANPVYQQVFGDVLTQQDSGFAVIHITGHVLNENRRIVWGVAGWNESDSNASVDFILRNGLPDAGIRNKY